MNKLMFLAITLTAYVAAYAESNSGSAKAAFDTLDKNKDGKLSQEEAKADSTVAAAFTLADKSGDNTLSKAEFNAYFNRP